MEMEEEFSEIKEEPPDYLEEDPAVACEKAEPLDENSKGKDEAIKEADLEEPLFVQVKEELRDSDDDYDDDAVSTEGICDTVSENGNHVKTKTPHATHHTDGPSSSQEEIQKVFICVFCNKPFNRKGNLNKHIRTHTRQKPFLCHICSKVFNEKANLTAHLRTHTKEKPFECERCKKGFSQKHSLEIHIRSHTGEKPYSCDVCESTFSCRGNLVTHKRLHSNELPFSCNICEKRFNRKYSLNDHLAKKHSWNV